MKKTVTVKYDAGHSYDFDYKKEVMFCPNCGKREIWVECSDGDYYMGPQHVCSNCDFSFCMPSAGRNDQIAIQLKE